MKVKYLVLSLNKNIIVPYPEGNVESKLGGCAGYLPVFNTMKQAEKNAKGKFEIIPIGIHKMKAW